MSLFTSPRVGQVFAMKPYSYSVHCLFRWTWKYTDKRISSRQIGYPLSAAARLPMRL